MNIHSLVSWMLRNSLLFNLNITEIIFKIDLWRFGTWSKSGSSINYLSHNLFFFEMWARFFSKKIFLIKGLSRISMKKFQAEDVHCINILMLLKILKISFWFQKYDSHMKSGKFDKNEGNEILINLNFVDVRIRKTQIERSIYK